MSTGLMMGHFQWDIPMPVGKKLYNRYLFVWFLDIWHSFVHFDTGKKEVRCKYSGVVAGGISPPRMSFGKKSTGKSKRRNTHERRNCH